jgi:hypothetical protein
MTAAVALSVEVDLGLRLYARWTANTDASSATGFNYTGMRFAPLGEPIFNQARSRGEWVFTASGGWNTVRWFEPPCTFTGFTPPAGARVRTGVVDGGTCWYSVNYPPYEASSASFTQYPYMTEADLVLNSFMEVAPFGSNPFDYQNSTVPLPPVETTEPEIVGALEEDGSDELRRGLLVAVVADRLQRNNPGIDGQPQLDRATAITIARQCVDYVRTGATLSSSDCGSSSLPLFVSGGDQPAVTAHITKALAYHPSWLTLRYIKKPKSASGWTRKYPQTDTSLPGWTDAGCVGTGQVTACDEYPFLATEQGGQEAVPLPHLELLDWVQNSGHGSSFGAYLVTKCQMELRRSSPMHGAGWFLVVPAPFPSVLTRGYCNGSNP